MHYRIMIAAAAIAASASTGHAASWRCEFSVFKEPSTFIDLGDGTGKTVGALGVTGVWVVRGRDAISFIEPVNSGAVMTTTIYTPTGEAVHSRNTVMGGLGGESPFVVSQTMGRCSPAD